MEKEREFNLFVNVTDIHSCHEAANALRFSTYDDFLCNLPYEYILFELLLTRSDKSTNSVKP